MTYGYCRISTNKQSIERQIRNIQDYCADAFIVQEVYTGKKINRVQFDKMLKQVKLGDIIIFDSVSRMSRNAEDGFKLYKDLYEQGINLVFLKERHIDTDSYKQALQSVGVSKIDTGNTDTDKLVNGIMQAVNEFMFVKVEQDIYKAFEQAQKEVDDLSQRTKEGLITAKLNGKQIGQVKGATYNVKKSDTCKEQIKKYSKDFDGTLNDVEVMKLIGIARNTYYKYKKEISE